MEKSGHCHCGKISYQVNAKPIRMAQCHCNACRRLTGTGHNVQAFFKKKDVKIEGETASYQSLADSSNMRERHFCPNCGSRLFSYNSASPDIIGISAGTFDDSSWFKPQIILYNSQRPKWDIIDDNIERRELM